MKFFNIKYLLPFLIFIFCSDQYEVYRIQEKSWKIIERGLADENPEVRANACEAFGSCGIRQAVPFLKPLLADKDAFVRFNAACALASLGDTSGISLLNYAASSGDTLQKIFALGALNRISRMNTGILKEIFQKTNSVTMKIICAAELLQCGEISYLKYIENIDPDINPLILALCIDSIMDSGKKLPESLIMNSASISHPTLKIAYLSYEASEGKQIDELVEFLNYDNKNIRSYAAGNLIRLINSKNQGIWKE